MANLLVALLPKDSSLYYPKYLYYYLNTFKDSLLVPLMKGTSNVSLKEKDIYGVQISLPPLETQQRIVAKIEALAAKIEEARGLQNEVDKEFQYFLQSVFSQITENAPTVPMSEVAPLLRRPVKVIPEEKYYELGIRSFAKGTFHKSPLSGIELGTKRIFYIHENDLVFNIVFAWEGAVAVAKPEDHGRVGSHRFLTCVPKEGVATSRYLSFYFSTPKGLQHLGDASPGGAGRNRTLGLEALSRIRVPIPSFAKQVWFGQMLRKVEEVKLSRNSARPELDALLPSVLAKAFAGEL